MTETAWLYLALVGAAALVVVTIAALLERGARRELGDPPYYARPIRPGSLPVFADCGECLLAREAGTRTHARHLASVHGYLVMEGRG